MVKTKCKYLRYWWQPNSKIDPAKVNEKYFRVCYDLFRRHVLVETYTSDHKLIWVSKFFWKRNKLIRSESYLPNGQMEYYLVYKYGRLGILRGVEHHSPNGELVKFETDGL